MHHQGIIHRDIKPANLLWTEDRRQVKIGDFGVSHFSYAQRLSAAGEVGVQVDPTDPVLWDESDLAKRAGTPSFLAPEVVYEHTADPSAPPSQPAPQQSSSSASTTHNGNLTTSLSTIQHIPLPSHSLPRPPITKAIDIWALGVTLYCLLFGNTPFIADPAIPGSEWSLYNAVCNQDWEVGNTMGFDQVKTGGRHPKREDSEGGIVIRLLEQFLEKDMKHRITLEQVKVSLFQPWCSFRHHVVEFDPLTPPLSSSCSV